MINYYVVLKVKVALDDEYSSDDLYSLAKGQGDFVLYESQADAEKNAQERAEEETSHFLVCEVCVANEPENDELDGETRKRNELDFNRSVNAILAPSTKAETKDTTEDKEYDDSISGEFYVVLPEANVKTDEYDESDLNHLATQFKQPIALIPDEADAHQLAYFRKGKTGTEQVLFKIKYSGPKKEIIKEEIDEDCFKEYQAFDLAHSKLSLTSWGQLIEKKEPTASASPTSSNVAGLPGFMTAKEFEEQRKRDEEGRRMLRTAGSFDATLLLSGGPSGAHSTTSQEEKDDKGSALALNPERHSPLKKK